MRGERFHYNVIATLIYANSIIHSLSPRRDTNCQFANKTGEEVERQTADKQNYKEQGQTGASLTELPLCVVLKRNMRPVH